MKKPQLVTATMIFSVLSFVFSASLAATPTLTPVASNPNSIPGDNFETAQDYFTIQDGSRRSHISMSPMDWFEQNLKRSQAAQDELPLLNWIDHQSPPDLPTEPYNRKKHFGTWIVDSSLGGCYNTRARVLIRDSQIPVTFNTDNSCTVESGKWIDPYSGQTFTSASDIQIDHVVPLKHAYLSGAWNWQKSKRCLYANFLVDDFHLRSVSGHENMKKGDMSPSGYVPPDSSDVCSYVADWLKIKMVWNLILAPSEAAGIQKAIADYHCDLNEFKMSAADLQEIRQKILSLQDVCRE